MHSQPHFLYMHGQMTFFLTDKDIAILYHNKIINHKFSFLQLHACEFEPIAKALYDGRLYV